MYIFRRRVTTSFLYFTLLATALITGLPARSLHARELSVEDFKFDGPLGSAGAAIERVDTNHFKVVLSHAPEHPTWCNMLQFQILQNARGNRLRLDVYFYGGNDYRFNHYSFSSWSYNGSDWHPIKWEKQTKESSKGDTLLFPTFEQDTVYFGHQVPMSYENVTDMMEKWDEHPDARVRILGKSLEGRNIYRLEITDPQSPYPRQKRWVHYFGNQHPGEHNAQWRMSGMIEWLLSEAGKDCRRRSISHFVLMMYPDAPSHGWYRTGVQGVDGNRSYSASGADEQKQAHEAYIVQKDLEKLMASQSPVTDLWCMHTWGGVVEPIMLPGPEMGAVLPSWERLRGIMEQNDSGQLVKTLAVAEKPGNPAHWNNGPHVQFGITTVLCEGAGNIITKEDNMASGVVIMKSLAQYYTGSIRDTINDTIQVSRSSPESSNGRNVGTIRNDTVWKDTDGNEIWCNGGHMIREGDTFYWVGYETRPGMGSWNTKLYSSTNLADWKFEHNILKREGPFSILGWAGRPGLLHNRVTGQYALIFEADSRQWERHKVGFACCDTVNGSYKFVRYEYPEGDRSTGDQSVYQEGEDGYLVCTLDKIINGKRYLNRSLAIFKLTDDYLNIEAKVYEGFGNVNGNPSVNPRNQTSREASHIIKVNDTYYWFSSGLQGWNSTETKYATAESLSGPWSELKVLATEPASTDSYNTQHDLIIPVVGSEATTYLYVGDRYSQHHGKGVGRNILLPLAWDRNEPRLKWFKTWKIDTATGIWRD